MPTRTLLPAMITALLCISLPAGGQDHAPDGTRKTGTVGTGRSRISARSRVPGAVVRFKTRNDRGDGAPHRKAD